MKKNYWLYFIVPTFCLLAMSFIDSRLTSIGSTFIEMRESEASQLSSIFRDNYDSISSISNKDKEALIELYSDKELIATDIKVLVGIMRSINFVVFGLLAAIYIANGIYKLIVHNKQRQHRPSGWTR